MRKLMDINPIMRADQQHTDRIFEQSWNQAHSLEKCALILRDYVSSTDYMFNKSRNNHSGGRESESGRVGGDGYREGTTTNSHNESHNNHGHLRDIAEGRAKQTRSLADKYLLAIWEERKLLLTSTRHKSKI